MAKQIVDATGKPLERFSFTVIEDEWHNGARNRQEEKKSENNYDYENPLGEPALKNDEGFMCCLGFACRAMGVKNGRLLNSQLPADIEGITLESKAGRYFLNSELKNNQVTRDIAAVNDDPRLSPSKIKAKLKSLFNKLNIDINFVPTKQQLPAIVRTVSVSEDIKGG